MLAVELAGAVDDQFFFIDGVGNTVHLRIKGAGIHVSQLKEAVLFSGKIVIRCADTVVVTQDVAQPDPGKQGLVNIGRRKGDSVHLEVVWRVDVDGQFRRGGDKSEINIGLDMDPVVHTELFNGLVFRVLGHQQNTDAVLHFDVYITAELQELRKGLLSRNMADLLDQRVLLFRSQFSIHRAVFQKRGAGGFVLHMYHLR